jgi:peroxiredoxin
VLTHAEFSIGGGSGGKAFATWTAKVKVTELPAATDPTCSVHELPEFPSGVHVQPGDELAATNEVSCGTVSSMLTPSAPWVPTFET